MYKEVTDAIDKRCKEKEYAICFHAVSVLAKLCAASPNVIVDKLTGYLWDEKEAEGIKASNGDDQ